MKTLLLLVLLPWLAWGQSFRRTSKNGVFYFTDKHQKPIKKLGEWEKACDFDHRGLAKVGKEGKSYFLDTLGNTYLLAKTLEELTPETRALELDFPASYANINEKNVVLLEAPDYYSQQPPQTQDSIVKDSSKTLEIKPVSDSIPISEEPFIATDSPFRSLSNISFKDFSQALANNTQLEILFLHCSLTKLPDEIGKLQNLKQLDLSDCRRLKSLSPSIGKLKNLQTLHLSRCQSLESLPPEIGRLKSLKHLTLGIDKLTSLPAEIGQLTSLKELCIYGCNQLTTLPPEIGKLHRLERISILFRKKDIHLPAEIGQLRRLKRIYCEQAAALPTEIGQLRSLKELCLSDAKSLDNLPAIFGQLANLQKLVLEECETLTTLPYEHLKKLKQLKQITLRNTPISQTEAQRNETEEKIKAILPKCEVVW